MLKKKILNNLILLILGITMTFLLFAIPSSASTPKERYFDADRCYQNLKKKPDVQKYRHRWMLCIAQYESVYIADPHNRWAAAGMYRAAQLYLELYKISSTELDKFEAIDLLHRIVNRYPGSAYRARSLKIISSFENNNVQAIQQKQKHGQKHVQKQKQKQSIHNENKNEHPEPVTIKSKKSVKYLTINNIADDKGAVGDKSVSNNKTAFDKKNAANDKNIYNSNDTDTDNDTNNENDANNDKNSDINDNSEYDKADRSENTKFQSVPVKRTAVNILKKRKRVQSNTETEQKKEDKANNETNSPSESNQLSRPADIAANYDIPPANDLNQSIFPRVNADGDAYITGLRYWSTPNYTRVVINVAEERTYTPHLLKKIPSLNKPQRLYVDIDKSVLGKNVPSHTIINDNLLTRARAGQHSPHSVRVVVDIKSFDNYKIFSLKDPFRMVIDVWGDGSQDGTSSGNAAAASSSPSGSIPSSSVSTIPKEQLSTIGSNTDQIHASSIAKQLALGVRTIVIDPGHGGKDPGAIGYLKGVYEKDVVLSISRKLAKKMRDRLKCNVILTRSKDRYLTLEERTAIANTKNADLFLSIHCNAARSKKLAGIETYYLNLATDDQAINVAARENATSRKNISDLQSILNDLMKNAKINESARLATIVQDRLCKGMSKKYSGIRNLGVKQAPFYVLLGATMPSILIETAFISNKKECKRMINSTYQNALCDAIIDGVEKYIKETDPRAL